MFRDIFEEIGIGIISKDCCSLDTLGVWWCFIIIRHVHGRQFNIFSGRRSRDVVNISRFLLLSSSANDLNNTDNERYNFWNRIAYRANNFYTIFPSHHRGMAAAAAVIVQYINVCWKGSSSCFHRRIIVLIFVLILFSWITLHCIYLYIYAYRNVCNEIQQFHTLDAL